MLQTRSYLLLYSDQIVSRTSQGVLPEDSVVHNIDRFQWHFYLIACNHKMTGNDVPHAHFPSGFLQIDICSGISVGDGERPHGKSRVIAQCVGNIIGQSDSKKVEVFRGTCVLEGQNCYRLRAVGLRWSRPAEYRDG